MVLKAWRFSSQLLDHQGNDPGQMITPDANDTVPFVSVLVPMRNEEHHLARCLDSILQTDYSKQKMEIIVIDGKSTDGSVAIVKSYSKKYPFIQLLDNHQQIQAAALNLGLDQARGQIIIRMDAHTVYAPDYIRQCVFALENTGAASVGGQQKAVGSGYLSNAIGVAFSSPFAAGDAKYRYSDIEQWVDTVYLGAWRARTLRDLGGFNEKWAINEDYELNYRLRKSGGKILLSPKIKCYYYVRGSLSNLAKQYLRYGFWKVKTLSIHPDSLRWRQLACPTFITALVFSVALIPVWPIYSMIVPAAYILANVTASLWEAVRRGFRYLPLLPVIFTTMHLAWGTGFWAGLAGLGLRRLTTRS
jgi:glycosyltransferase involved in cell wall biosynthesis